MAFTARIHKSKWKPYQSLLDDQQTYILAAGNMKITLAWNY
jgi:hypothetical protein